MLRGQGRDLRGASLGRSWVGTTQLRIRRILTTSGALDLLPSGGPQDSIPKWSSEDTPTLQMTPKPRDAQLLTLTLQPSRVHVHIYNTQYLGL